MATPTTEENIMDRQSEIPDVLNAIERANDDLNNAESCETAEDFDDNLASAEDALNEALKQIALVRKM